MKTAFKIFLLLAVVGYLVFAIWKFAGEAEDRTCEGVNVEIVDSIADGFITGTLRPGIEFRFEEIADLIEYFREKSQKMPDRLRCVGVTVDKGELGPQKRFARPHQIGAPPREFAAFDQFAQIEVAEFGMREQTAVLGNLLQAFGGRSLRRVVEGELRRLDRKVREIIRRGIPVETQENAAEPSFR